MDIQCSLVQLSLVQYSGMETKAFQLPICKGFVSITMDDAMQCTELYCTKFPSTALHCFIEIRRIALLTLLVQNQHLLKSPI